MKMEYNIISICDGCNEENKTRKIKHLDPRHHNIENNLCVNCDKSIFTISKIMKHNTKIHGLGDAFGLKNGNRKFIIFGDNYLEELMFVDNYIHSKSYTNEKLTPFESIICRKN